MIPVSARFLDKERTVAGPGFNRWLVPPAALCIHLCIGMAYGFSVFWLPLTRAVGVTQPVPCPASLGMLGRLTSTTCDWDKPLLGWTYTFFFVFLGSSAAIFGPWLERAGPRKAGVVAAVCWCGGLAIAAAGVAWHQLWLLWLGAGVIGGIGLGIGYISPVSTLVRWFPDRRGMATGLAIMGFGGGAMVGAPLAERLMRYFAGPETVGVWQTLLVMAAVYLAFMLLGACAYRIPPEGWAPRGRPPAVAAATSLTARQACRTPQFWLLWLVLCLNVSAGIGVIGMASPMLQEVFGGRLIGTLVPFEALDAAALGRVAAVGAGFTGLLSLFNIVGRFFWSSVSDSLGRRPLYAIFFLAGAVLYAAVPAAGRAGNVPLFCGIFCVILTMYGGGFAAIPAYLADLFGTAQLGAIHGRLLTAWSVAGILGPALVNYLNEHQVAAGAARATAYDGTMFVLAGLLVAGFFCNLCVRPVSGVERPAPSASAPAPAGVEARPARGSWPLVVAFWALVALPLAWGLFMTGRQSAALFAATPSVPVAVAPDVAAELDAQLAILRRRDAALGIRGIVRFAVEAAGVGWNADAVEEALAITRGMQDANPASETFGNFRWRLGDAGVSDPNAVDFVLQMTTLLEAAHADRLTPRSRQLLAEIHATALVASDRHLVKPGYTNIYLMKVWSRLALGRSADAPLAAGRRLWDEWRVHVAAHGITEYSSPTYYGIDLDSLGLIARYAGDPEIRAEAGRALEWLWTAIAANWFEPARRLSGPHSRDYDYLLGRGYLDEHLVAAGWVDAPGSTESAGWLPGAPRRRLVVFRGACHWQPPADLRSGAGCRFAVPRFVVQRFGPQPWARATNHVGRSLAIGVAGECRGPEDKSLAISLPGGAATPNVALVFDRRGDPYGRIKQPTAAGGPRKAHHLRTFLASSQRGPQVTAAWYFDPSRMSREPGTEQFDRLQAHLILPLAAAVWDRDVVLSADGEMPAASVVFLRAADAVVGIRFLPVGREELDPVRLRLRSDAPHLGARRLTAEFAAERSAGQGLLVLDIEAREGCDAAAFEAFRHEFARREVSATAEGDHLRLLGTLPLEADLRSLRRISCEPQLAADERLLVDGIEIAPW